jgi:nucleoside permease NupC
MTSFLQPATGILALTMIAVIFSEDRRANKSRLIATGVGIQFVFALLLLKVPFIKDTVALINQGVLALQKASEAGTSLVFGFLGGAPLPFQESQPGAAYILAFQALPLALFISAFAALLYHWRILPKIVGVFSWLLGKALKMNGATSFAVSANIFVGMVEAPLLVRPYLAQLSRSDLFVVMASGHVVYRRYRLSDLCRCAQSDRPRCSKPSVDFFDSQCTCGHHARPPDGSAKSSHCSNRLSTHLSLRQHDGCHRDWYG